MNHIKSRIKQLPGINKVVRQRDQLIIDKNLLIAERDHLSSERDQLLKAKEQLDWLMKKIGPFSLPGHFYSPIPDFELISQEKAAIWGPPPREIEGIDVNEDGQLQLFEELKYFYNEIPFPAKKSKNCRYYFENPAFSYADAIILYSMIRYTKPGRIIEVGCGYSSCVTLDTNELFFDGEIDTVFIEPYPDLFYSLIKPRDKEKVRVLPSRLQDVPLAEFDILGENDILFIDSTHVSKIHSDVNYIFFNILPHLKSGVYIHFHDIFYPFEYPQHWIDEGRALNECYMMRAFLEYNKAFKIIFFSTFMEYFHEDLFKEHMPLYMKQRGGCLWLQKL